MKCSICNLEMKRVHKHIPWVIAWKCFNCGNYINEVKDEKEKKFNW